MMQMWFVFWVAQRLVQGDLVEMCEGDTQGMLQLVTSGTSTSFGPPAPESTHGPKTSQAASQPSSSPKPSTSDTSTKSTKSTTSTTIQPPAAAITTFQWEPHWQCAEADASCTHAAQAKFQQLVEESGAQIAAALELQGAAVPNWISSTEYEDAVSIMVAPGWQVLKEGGGNICCGGQRGLAVMLVKPPWPVSNCEELCVMRSIRGILQSKAGNPSSKASVEVQPTRAQLHWVIGMWMLQGFLVGHLTPGRDWLEAILLFLWCPILRLAAIPAPVVVSTTWPPTSLVPGLCMCTCGTINLRIGPVWMMNICPLQCTSLCR